jgi:hypothetical protein
MSGHNPTGKPWVLGRTAAEYGRFQRGSAGGIRPPVALPGPGR